MPAAGLLIPPENGATVRMYRQGHGDCFLIAFAREGGGDPYYVMVDCGYKPGSQAFVQHHEPIGKIVEHLHRACGGHLDLVILTHEHQDHLNGIWKKAQPYFRDFEVDRAWVAWTEDPGHALANELRKRHKDQLLGLLAARARLADAVGADDPAVSRVDALLDLELGGNTVARGPAAMLAAAGQDLENSVNKQGLKLIKEKAAARKGCRCLRPGGAPLRLDGADGIRAFILGPPENADLIADEDPHDREGFPPGQRFSLVDAVGTPPEERASPFRRHFSEPLASAFADPTGFLAQHYGEGDGPVDVGDQVPVSPNAPWRRIDNEWLYAVETLALKLNAGINNTSLVVAFELPKSRKVLFFAADAQRGNWASWQDVTFADGDRTVTARDLLARAVLYKVGHHGSHNATLSGTTADEHANLAWMGQGAAASEFTAMITAVTEWAMTKNDPPWVHPLPSIREALLHKAQGRVFQTDQDEPERPTDVSEGAWEKFTERSVFEKLYFDWTVLDE